MIWLTWRQFRAQALVAALAVAAVAAFLIYLGVRMRSDYAGVLGCTPSECAAARISFGNTYSRQLTLAGVLVLATPALIGVFWGAPLLTRELEERTDRLVWNQSITRVRWLAVKLAVLGLAAVVVSGALSLLLTWNASRYDQFLGERFVALNFASRNVVPLGHAAFAFTLGTVTGLLVRRTLPAMALTLALFAVVQLGEPALVRAHLMTPVTTSVAFDEDAMSRSKGFGVSPSGGAKILGYTMPGAWSLSEEAAVVNADGSPLTQEQLATCRSGNPEEHIRCLTGLGLHFDYTYHPPSRYWTFQWIELSAYLAASLLLAGSGLWWLRRRTPSR
ncbi:transmembrane transport protein [Symbioplanes lichenis]|uniref:transmembrane transport protein n=1 Tax=Symbioplanes lichenis TaxID=1629072 RepID=UPI0027392D3E|nr:transmembrane transport protein [Actinoplanes lichenis]